MTSIPHDKTYEQQFEDHSISQLLSMQHEMVLTAVDLGMAGSDVTPRKSFRNRDDALTTCRRLHAAITARRNKGVATAEEVAYESLIGSPPETKERSMPRGVKKEVAETNGGRRGRASKWGEDMKITVLAENPKRAGTRAHEKFKLYRSGMSIKTYIEKVGDRSLALFLIGYDVKHEYVSVA